MSRRLTGSRLVLATHNPGKIRELEELLAPHGIEVVPGRALGLIEPVEDAASFADNARIKAHAAASATGLPALADDSGLEVAALGGAPGVHSARWAGPERDFAGAMARLHAELVRRCPDFTTAPRRAAFVAAVCLAWPDGHEEVAEGRVEGEIVWPPRGAGGFGYDPIFVPAGHELTFAEMPAEAKALLSHRGRAIRALLARCLPRA